jgi:hypothetical protein
MAPFIQTANLTLAPNGVSANTIAVNPYKTEGARDGTHQRPSVLRVFSYNVQNQNVANPIAVTWCDSSGTNIAGPFIIPSATGTGNWTERATPPGFLFETTRSNSTPYVSYDLQLNVNAAQQVQVFVEYAFTFAPGRVGG